MQQTLSLGDGNWLSDKKQDKFQFGEALQKVVEYLQGEPLLLFVLGAVIVLAVSSALGNQNIWTLMLPLAMAIIGLFAWIFMEVRKIPPAFSHPRSLWHYD